MKNNSVIDAIKERRSKFRFRDEDIDEGSIEAILEAGRWAPSFANLQPWKLIVIKDEELKEELYEIAGKITLFREGLEEAPVIFAVAVDQEEDPDHFIEAGAVVTQNMALAAHSLGLASYWVGLFDIDEDRSSVEREAKSALEISEEYRLISLLPVGKSDQKKTGERKELDEIVIRK
jgi:nitroreductase